MLESLRDLWTAVLGICGCGAYVMAGFRVFRSAEVVRTSSISKQRASECEPTQRPDVELSMINKS
jgi:hypothetical protein